MRSQKSLSSIINLPVLLTVLLLVSSPLTAAFAADLVMGPINPAFTSYKLHVPFSQGGEPGTNRTGFIPAPVDRSHLKALVQHRALQGPLAPPPASYDLRTLGKLTPVRNQLNCGSCWAFGTMASMESALLSGETRDFSENNLKNNHGFDWGPCDGGNIFLSTAYLMRWSGPVNETDDLYQDNDNPSPTGLTVQKHSQNIIHLPPRASSTDNTTIKNALMNYGAVTMAYYHSNTYYNSTNHTYYYNGSANSNHEVAIVGWDDNYDRSRFSPNTPAGNGAFIVRNSWGTSWGESGYFYISYYDTTLGYNDLAVFSRPQGTTNYGRMYSYDPLGMIGNWGYGNTTAWFANIFTAQGNDKINAVSFYNSSINSPYELYVYTGLTNAANPRSGTLAATKTGTLADSGYLTIPLASPVAVTSGQLFSVVVKLTTPGLNYPIPGEWAVSGYSSAAAASAGQSFISSAGTSWQDATSSDSTLNVCIKAYTAGKPVPTDFDGDAKVDIAIWRPGNGGWFIIPSSTSVPYTAIYGADGDKTVPGDYDGDAKTDVAVWRPSNGTWYITNSSTGSQTVKAYGISTDIPVPGDYDGDGKTDVAVWRPSNGTWYIINSNDGSQTVKSYGASSDTPVPGDYDGDGKTDAAVWRPASGTWYISNSSNGTQTVKSYGASSDTPVPGNYDGDAKTDIAVWRPSNGIWYIFNSSTSTQTVKAYGASTDTPIPADYDGDAVTDIAVWRPSTGTWYVTNSSSDTQTVQQWGESTDKPLKSGQPIQ